MKSNLRKWGNSLGIRVPKIFVEKLGMGENSVVDIDLDGEKIVITKSEVFDLDDLLKGIDDNNLHKEVDLGPIKGREIW